MPYIIIETITVAICDPILESEKLSCAFIAVDKFIGLGV